MPIIRKISVSNMSSTRWNPSGKERAIANQFQIVTEDGTYFQSYQSVIVYVPRAYDAKTVLDINKWDFSNTTSKYRNQFLGETKSETMKKIKRGEYLLEDLNLE